MLHTQTPPAVNQPTTEADALLLTNPTLTSVPPDINIADSILFALEEAVMVGLDNEIFPVEDVKRFFGSEGDHETMRIEWPDDTSDNPNEKMSEVFTYNNLLGATVDEHGTVHLQNQMGMAARLTFFTLQQIVPNGIPQIPQTEEQKLVIDS